MKINLELEIDANDLFITNKGIIPFKDIKDGYLTIGKYRCRIMEDYEVRSFSDAFKFQSMNAVEKDD